jgi:ADP-ribosylglycohydrolase
LALPTGWVLGVRALPALIADPKRIRAAWEGRVSGCILGKPVEVLSFQQGHAGLSVYLEDMGALPLRDYVPLEEGSLVDELGRACCREHIVRAEPDDDINYTVLALVLLEEKGTAFDTEDVARAWLRLVPAGTTWTAERAAYRVLLDNMADEFVNGAPPGFDLVACSASEYNEWIGAQIRADLYGWVCPGRPRLAAELARRDASLSHRGDGLYGAMFIAALGALIPATPDLDAALDAALTEIPKNCSAAAAVRFGRSLAGSVDAVARLHSEYDGLPPVHTLNNLALVTWALCSAEGDFSSAIGNAVAAGWDTDCNGATVGGLMGLAGAPIPGQWTRPWAGRVGVSLAGHSELALEDLVTRTVAVARRLEEQLAA